MDKMLITQLKAISAKCGWDFSENEGRMALRIPVEENRQQVVCVTQDHDIAGQVIARFWTFIGPAEGIDPVKCLNKNAEFAYGSFAIQGDDLVLVDTQLVSEATPLQLTSAISNLASYADLCEEQWFRADKY
jgi:hypothetical protein